MKTYASILLLLASAGAAYGHSAKSNKYNVLESMSFALLSTKSAKRSKSLKEPIRRVLVNDFTLDTHR